MQESNPPMVSLNHNLSLLLVLFVLFSTGCITYSVSPKENWSKEIEVHRSYITQSLTVVDNEAESTLFTYYDAPASQPILVQKAGANHWISVFEKPANLNGTRVIVEKINENEFRVKFVHDSK